MKSTPPETAAGLQCAQSGPAHAEEPAIVPAPIEPHNQKRSHTGNGSTPTIEPFSMIPAWERETIPQPKLQPIAEVAETYREVSWAASILKQIWPYAMAVVCFIFATGVAWQKLQASQEKIEAVAVKVQSHDVTLADIREGVAVIRGILEGEQRRFSAATVPRPEAAYYPPHIAASAPPALTSATPPHRRQVKKPQPKPASGWSLFR
jgi:hypothetical protein